MFNVGVSMKMKIKMKMKNRASKSHSCIFEKPQTIYIIASWKPSDWLPLSPQQLFLHMEKIDWLQYFWEWEAWLRCLYYVTPIHGSTMMFFILGLNFEQKITHSKAHLHICYLEDYPQLSKGTYNLVSLMDLAPQKEYHSLLVRSDFTREVAETIYTLSEWCFESKPLTYPLSINIHRCLPSCWDDISGKDCTRKRLSSANAQW